MKILVLHGPNLNLLGKREPEIYGRQTLADINRELRQTAEELQVELRIIQSNHEGDLVAEVQKAGEDCAAFSEPGRLYHTSAALRDALAVGLPAGSALKQYLPPEDFATPPGGAGR